MKDLPSKDSTEEMRREFDKAGYWPNEVMWKAWQQSWNAAIASKQEEKELTRAKACLLDSHNYIGKIEKESVSRTKQLAQANATIAALQAKIEEAEGQEPIFWIDPNDIAIAAEYKSDTKYVTSLNFDGCTVPLFTRPPITSNRELALLGVIEQMREALNKVRRHYNDFQWDMIKEALALTPDMTALKEHDARVLENLAISIESTWSVNLSNHGVVAELRRMASELRQP